MRIEGERVSEYGVSEGLCVCEIGMPQKLQRLNRIVSFYFYFYVFAIADVLGVCVSSMHDTLLFRCDFVAATPMS